jgi:hypothetical protein
MKKQFILLVLLFVCVESSATHLKGGQIYYKRISHLTYEFTFIGYRDVNGVPFGQGMFDFGDGTKYGDEGNEEIPWDSIEDLGNGVERWSFKLIHVYSASASYTVSYKEDFRSAEILNIQSSIATSFYVEARVDLNPFINSNSSPILAYHPSFTAVQGEKYIVSFAHKDVDGDSLRYKLVTPLQDDQLTVNGYKFPNNTEFGANENTIFKLDPFSGNLIWDNAVTSGNYSIAIKTEEWRKINGEYRLIGHTVIDFVLSVFEASTPFVLLELPSFSCIESGQDYHERIAIENPSKIDLKMYFETDLDSLIINGMKVDNWNELWADSIFSDLSMNLDISISSSALIKYPGFNNVIFSITGTVLGSDESRIVNYSTNSLVANGCLDEMLVSSITEQLAYFTIQNAEIVVNFTNSGWHEVSIYSINGRLLKHVSRNHSKEIKIAYPFIDNTVYLILINSDKGKTTKKILFTSKD